MVDKKTSDIIEYIVCCISAFAERFELSNVSSYTYLKNYKALAFLEEYYDIEHTFSIDDAVDDMYNICKRNGGTLPWIERTWQTVIF